MVLQPHMNTVKMHLWVVVFVFCGFLPATMSVHCKHYMTFSLKNDLFIKSEPVRLTNTRQTKDCVFGITSHEANTCSVSMSGEQVAIIQTITTTTIQIKWINLWMRFFLLSASPCVVSYRVTLCRL